MITEEELATYETLLLVINQEEYHQFLIEHVNIHEIGDEFEVYFFKGNKPYDEQVPYWSLAEYEDYAEIEYTGIDRARIKILRHYELQPYDNYFI